MDKNEFFRQATSRICGNLEIEAALVSSLNFLRQEIPVDRMLLQFFEEGLNAMRTVAISTPHKGKMLNLLTPISASARRDMMQFEKEYIKKTQTQRGLSEMILTSRHCFMKCFKALKLM